jgi:hypothetical protein
MSYGDPGIMVIDQGSRSVRSWLVKDWDDLVQSISAASAPVVRTARQLSALSVHAAAC